MLAVMVELTLASTAWIGKVRERPRDSDVGPGIQRDTAHDQRGKVLRHQHRPLGVEPREKHVHAAVRAVEHAERGLHVAIERGCHDRVSLGVHREVFPEPQTLFTDTPKIVGTDGRKMSKSYGNAVYLTEDPADIDRKLSRMVTDPRRARRTDPGEPEDCPAYTSFHKIYCTTAELTWAADGCRTAGIGCLECKKVMIKHVLADLEPVRTRRATLKPDDARDVLAAGNQRAQAIAEATMAEVRDAMGLA